ncbi:hypothetical protein ES319_D08G032500v1 [Gossypium barbadense]|uniref:DUF4408 domain-containing protein n=2 Tax=Gossypium TaxID=3633 RepID=A0A5J5Q8U9_GOSBA|nr:hypothetical protein ES319_D08G032500v1 [Gossypium barbadense]TYG56068.1 hypothetical protein ES288_D08G034000v1 [Gossypium darwinii]
MKLKSLLFRFSPSIKKGYGVLSFNTQNQSFLDFKPFQDQTPKRGVYKMDQRENKEQKSLVQFMKTQFHGKFPHLVLSVSVFSLLLSHSCWLSLLRCFSFNFHNTLPFQLFSHNIDKNYMFLLCNGLLVFLAKFSGSISSSKYNNNLSVLDYDDEDEDIPHTVESLVLDRPKTPLSQEDEAIENSALMEETAAAEAEIETQNCSLLEEEDEGEKWGLDPLMKNGVFVGESTESTDELNKRFDEFIRKMKEELRVEARQQLVMI